MPVVSQQKKDKIGEQILHYLFSISPEAKFTADIAKELARDEEFIKILLNDLKKKQFVVEISKNSLGNSYTKRRRWRLSDAVYNIYQKQQTKNQKNTHNNTDFYESSF